MDGEEELLPPEGPRLPRRVRLGALVLTGLAVVALIAVKAWPQSGSHRAATTPTPPPAPTTLSTIIPRPGAPSSTELTTPPRPWPTSPGACDGATDLPIVTSRRPAEATGIHVLLGGDRLRTVDFDTPGVVAHLPGAHLAAGQFATDLYGAGYFSTGTCTSHRPRILRLGKDNRARAVTPSRLVDSVSVDGDRAWGVVYPTERHPHGYLVPLDGGHPVRLPAEFFPTGITSGVVVGTTGSYFEGTGSLLLVDATTGRVRTNLGHGEPVAVGSGLVVWTPDCQISYDVPCTLYRRAVTSGATRTYRIPRPPGFSFGVISPGGRLLAFAQQRAGPDVRFVENHPIPPCNVAILHLDTGSLDIVPGVETPPKASPGLAFSPDGRWLVMALDAGTRTRLLAWHPGLARPYETASVAGTSLYGPPIVTLP